MSNGKLGLWSCTTYVVGNMIGSGIFMLPATLAVYGGISLISWIISAVGAIILAFIFKSLSQHYPGARGGPYAFAREGLGEFPAFTVAWGYWISIWTTNAALAVAFVSYLTVFIPFLKESYIASTATGLGAIWFLTWLNTRPVTLSGKVQTITTALKIIPLLLIGVIGLFYLNTEHFSPINRTSDSTGFVLLETVALTLFAFLGLESATIPAHKVNNAKKIIPLATILGTLISITIYMLGSIAVMGIIAPAALTKSDAPFADAATVMWGEGAGLWIGAGALISTFGALNGWILMQGQIPAAAARDEIFPSFFEKENQYRMPTTGLIVSSVLASILMMLNFSDGFAETYKFIILLATITSLLPYIFSSVTYLKIQYNNKNTPYRKLKIAVAVFSLIFAYAVIKGSGEAAFGYGLLLLLAGVPFYLYMKMR